MKAHTPLLTTLAAVTTITLSACTTAPVLRPPPAKLRDSLGGIAVVALTNSSRIRYQVPDSKADIAAENQSFELVTPRMIVGNVRGLGGGPEAAIVGAVAFTTPLLVMGGAPLAQEIRRAYGLVVADSAAAVATARTMMDTAIAPVRFEQLLRERLISELKQKSPATTLAASPRDAETLLELMVYEPNVSGREGINPGLRLSLGLRVRLVDARKGQELYYDYLDYRGAKHTLVKWAADDAREFHDEIARCLARLTGEIVAQLFSRPSDEIVGRTTLAALGLERRPPAPGSLGWSVALSTRTLARN
ncbi:MAG: hypothetical protein Q8N18_14470 [Opitutaceae bacterium]|nr:hypothetical protein [Opitutaceae bacterium]